MREDRIPISNRFELLSEETEEDYDSDLIFYDYVPKSILDFNFDLNFELNCLNIKEKASYVQSKKKCMFRLFLLFYFFT